MRFAGARMVAVAVAVLSGGTRAAAAPGLELFRPRMAAPFESLTRLRFQSFEQDYRYGTDVSDSTSVAGVDRDVRGVSFGVAGGRTLRGPAWSHAGTWRTPARAYQLAAPLQVDVGFDRIDAQFINVADYSYGVALDALWTGDGDTARGIAGFQTPVLTTRVAILHRSSHVSDDYLGRGGFGRNQRGLVEATGLRPRPPIKRAVLSYEVLETVASLEGSPRALRDGTVRVYLGGELKLGITGLEPRRFRSPAASAGVELRSAGNRGDVSPGALARAVNRGMHSDVLTTAWFAAFDVRLARPFDFASCDNPSGDGEVWTPRLWTNCPCGRELPYAGSWHALVGLSLFDPGSRDVSRGGSWTRHETVLGLEWYRGYSTRGVFLDDRRRDHPRWYVAPSLTLSF
jgi:hypothetical protein